MVVEKNFEILTLRLSSECSASELLDSKSGVLTYTPPKHRTCGAFRTYVYGNRHILQGQYPIYLIK